MAQQPPQFASGADRIRSLTDDDSIFQAFDAYPWTKDKAFMSGLSAILGEPNSQNHQGSPADMATHARVFYYAQRIGVQINFARYHAWLAQHPDRWPPQVIPDEYLSRSSSMGDQADASSPPVLPWQQAAPKADLYVDRSVSSQSSSGAGGEPNYPMAFAEMLRLLKEGKPIPGIRQIPNTIARDPSVKPVGSRAAPKKPWESGTALAPLAPLEMDLPRSLDPEFPPLEGESPEADTETAPS
ncbi:Uncharacterized protein TCAP_03425 [Tolypocladium capitatum]|uniref:Uncharacterized protein n=1 Tax=Tolypocladium capitatum TaxID=45235 RepID=A0A2K3QGM3_9HYPO|nr:Uncharacterized protein TCAP_03425 [Tolypocladium capitatum]